MNYIGMDIHKQFTFAVVKDEAGATLATDKFSNTKECFQVFLQAFPPAETKVSHRKHGRLGIHLRAA